MTRCLGILAATVAVFLAATFPAAANHVQCGDVITQDTTLDSDLTCAGEALLVEGQGVTVDLGRHSIEGSGVDAGVFLLGVHEVTIRNGVIRGFAEAVHSDGGRGTAVLGVTFEGNGVGVRCAYAPECRIEGNVFRSNGTGIKISSADGGDPRPTLIRGNDVSANEVGMRLTGEAAIVSYNRVHGNSTDGISSDYGRPVTIQRNFVSDNGDEGIRLFFGIRATVTDNRITGNLGNGVGVHGGFGEGTEANVADNRIKRNGGDGVLVDGVSVTTTVQRNDTARNGDDGIGIDVSPCCGDVNVVRANKAYFNGDLGIDAGPGTTDGGGNRAKHNGNPAQCVGVSCR